MNASKTWLLAKSDTIAEAKRIFSDTGVSITTEGVLHLESALGSDAYRIGLISKRTELWKSELTKLSDIAQAQPHFAYCAFTLSRPDFFGAPVARGRIVPPFENHVLLVVTA